jgi:hypothetical protein
METMVIVSDKELEIEKIDISNYFTYGKYKSRNQPIFIKRKSNLKEYLEDIQKNGLNNIYQELIILQNNPEFKYFYEFTVD